MPERGHLPHQTTGVSPRVSRRGVVPIADDRITPAEQATRMFARAGTPTELHLITGEPHFPPVGGGRPARDIIEGWLDRFFPLRS